MPYTNPLQGNLTVSGVAIPTTFDIGISSFGVQFKESEPARWSLALVDPTGKYNPRNSAAGAFYGLMDDEPYTSGGANPKCIISGLTYAGVPFEFKGLPLHYGWTEDFEHQMIFFTWSGIDMSDALFRDSQTFETFRTKLDSKKTAKQVINTVLGQYNLVGRLEFEDFAIPTMHLQNSKPIEYIKALLEIVGAEWQIVDNNTFWAYIPGIAGSSTTWTFDLSDSKNIVEDITIDSQFPDIVNKVTISRAREVGQSDQSDEEVCFKPGTQVVTANGLKNIEAIIPGDLVLTHEGRFRPVIKTSKRQFSGKLIGLEAKGLEKVFCTSNHPWLAQYEKSRSSKNNLRKPESENWVKSTDLIAREKLVDSSHYVANDFHNLTMPIIKGENSENKIIDLLKTAPKQVKELNGELYFDNGRSVSVARSQLLSNDFGFVVGFFLGDGCVSNSRQVIFYINAITEQHIADKLQSIFISWGLNVERFTTDGNVECLRFSNRIWAAFFESFGKLAHGKFVPGWVLESSIQFRQSVLEGYITADGNINKNGVWAASTVSKSLAWGFRLLIWSLGHHASLSLLENKAKEIGGRIVKTGHIYQLRWRPTKVRSSSIIKNENTFGFFLKETKSIDYDGLVYNLHVEEDESYVTTGGICHNCKDFGEYTHTFKVPMNGIYSRPLEADLGFFSTFVCYDKDDNVVAVIDDFGAAYNIGLRANTAYKVKKVKFTWGARPNVLAAGGYGRIRFFGTPVDSMQGPVDGTNQTPGFDLAFVVSATYAVSVTAHGLRPIELSPNPMIPNSIVAKNYAYQYLRRIQRTRATAKYKVPLNPLIKPGNLVREKYGKINSDRTLYVTEVAHNFSNNPTELFTIVTANYYDPNFSVTYSVSIPNVNSASAPFPPNSPPTS